MTDIAQKADHLSFDGITHGFFGRAGGVSPAPFDSLNVSIKQGDSQENVTANLTIIADQLGIQPGNFGLLKQVHSINVVQFDGKADWDNRPEADGIVSNVPGTAIGIQTADCGPVLFCDPDNKVIGACHAGWKGAVGGIVHRTLDAMEELGANRHKIHAVLGPCIHPENYEVGDEFKANVLKDWPELEGHFPYPPGATKPHFDLPGTIVHQLESAHLHTAAHLDICTYANNETYFSHRKATHLDTKTGRQLSAIAIL
ncbi:peptidoglycan editing factor PgeF [Maritalea myrionectae]|uniref:peptidoglycan editing factor PgeF n=1 Tax=Maritalea myrionectae TaxID=454601 RepID=UPI000414CF2D|nr:peptidoglycan editing factor PgeF [Maritalea myrionectae]